MTYSKADLIKYRLERADETLEEAKILAQTKHWNTVANRLYYACYYAILAFFANENMNPSTHAGVKTLFNQQLVKTNRVEISVGRTYNELFNKRQEGDYADFQKFTEEDITPLIEQTEVFIDKVKKLII